ncbi:hypothetical protein BC834DRAFT_860525 [Gloeopeniophorella convolvens]|nr:hypothetical protein BC834DRAFT_860525 [Gloeopeniophorella convolvens]
MGSSNTVICPICSRRVPEEIINRHLDAGCKDVITGPSSPKKTPRTPSTQSVAPIFSQARSSGSRRDPQSSTQLGQRSAGSKLFQKRKSAADAAPPLFQPTPAKRSKQAMSISSRMQAASPLAERLRPNTLEDFVGQIHLTGPNSLLFTFTEKGATGSMIFWGPPGCGKTTLARLVAKRTNAVFKELSATVVGINDVRPIFEEAKTALQLTGRRTIIFLDEIHRFTRSQQDIFLPFLERGHVQLIGATTENPSFKLNGALLSRCRVFVLERLTDEEITEIVKKAIARVAPSGADGASAGTAASADSPAIQTYGAPSTQSSLLSFSPISSSQVQSSQSDVTSQPSTSTPASSQTLFPRYPHITPRIISSMASLSAGDARTALSLLEFVLLAAVDTPEAALLDSIKCTVATSYDRTGDARYDLISALHKCIRSSQGGAALYWLARMLQAGEDPLYIARRLVVCASEDIGMADAQALPLAMAALQACQVIGMPECRINLAHVVTYLSEAPKSTRALEGYNRALELAKQDMTLPVPLQMRNAPTGLMKDLGYAKDYKYQPDFAHPVTNEYLPLQIREEVILRKDGDLSGKTWDDDALKQWEEKENGGQEWKGRNTVAPSHDVGETC